MEQRDVQTPAANSRVEANLAIHGKLSYVQIPAVDAEVSAAFYRDVFGWELRGDARHRSFTDASGELIGAFMADRAISTEPGILPHIYVDGIDAVVAKIIERGCDVVKAPYAEGDLRVATFRDPAGNVVGLWQQGPR